VRSNHGTSALRAQLGPAATFELAELLEEREHTWSERVLNVAAERFERRLTEEVCGLRVALVREIHESKTDILRWTFLFWIGQVAAFGGLLAFMFRVTGR
jgi:hypothetical protein